MAFPQSINQDVYKVLIEKHKDLAYNIALKITKNDLDSEEIVQDSFVKAFNALDSFKNLSRFSTWFYRIVYNTAISAKRRKKIHTVEIKNNTPESYQIENVLKKLDESDRKMLIRDSLAKMNELDYTILSLYYYEELRLKQISDIVGKNKNYLKVLLKRARLKLYNNLSIPLKKELKELI